MAAHWQRVFNAPSSPLLRDTDMPETVLQVLRRTFRLRSLRPGQQEVIGRVLAGKPTLAVMPTGAGKSLCYQLPALMRPGVTVVVSPLIALMQDQCDGLRALGVAAVQVNSALPSDELHAAGEAIRTGRARIVLTTPERLADDGFQALLMAGPPVSLLVVDEAHCISQWGHDFRPAYLEIAPARQKLGKPPVLALTATAAGAVADDIRAQLGIPAGGLVDTGSYRPNLDYAVESFATEAEKMARTVALVRESGGAGLVYTATVKAAEAVRDALLAADMADVGLYHGRLPADERHTVQQRFMDGVSRVVVATNAFGLGIDKQDIRFVVHHQMPGALDAYYQESGRAGRDGENAVCTLLFLRKDRAVQQFFLAGRYPEMEDLRALVGGLSQPAPEGGWTLEALAGHCHLPLSKCRVAASLLRRHRQVVRGASGALRLRRADIDDATLERLVQSYRDKRVLDRASLERLVFYAQTGRCRWQVLLEAVGHGGAAATPAACSHCDNCRRIASVQAASAVTAPAAETHRPVLALFTAGQAVEVRRYGGGVVEAADAASVTVGFADGSRRVFQPDFVRPAGARKARPGPRMAA